MARTHIHPVDLLTDEQLRDLMLRVDTTRFPADLEQLWAVEHIRYRQTLRHIPPADGHRATLLDLGSSRPWVPFFRILLGYRCVTLNTNYPNSGLVSDRILVRGIETTDVRMSVFDVERDRFPFSDDSIDVVTCLEVLEHLAVDPMAMMAEVNRVLKPGGTFVLTTPNAVRSANLVKAILGEHPMGWSAYNGFDTNRHNREYTPSEIQQLLSAAGMDAGPVITLGNKNRGSLRNLLSRFVTAILFPLRRCPPQWRKDVILAVGRKATNTVDRRPAWLYFDMAERCALRTETLQGCPQDTSALRPGPLAHSCSR